MPLGRLILVEPSSPGNLGAAMRVAANFSVPEVAIVRPRVDHQHDEVFRWACGAHERLRVHVFNTLNEAASGCRTLVATASGRGRETQPLVTPREAIPEIQRRGLTTTALVFGNETSGLRRGDLDSCDLAIRVPTDPEFPVLNLTQSVAIILATISMSEKVAEADTEQPAPLDQVAAMIEHWQSTLLAIGFLDPACPDRIMRKLRRVFGRAGLTANEVAILRGICRQTLWAAHNAPLRWRANDSDENDRESSSHTPGDESPTGAPEGTCP